MMILFTKLVDEHPLKKGEFYLNVCETNYRRMEPPLLVAVSGLMGVGQFIHRVVEILGKRNFVYCLLLHDISSYFYKLRS